MLKNCTESGLVAAPGYAMCYLWALAGASPTLTPSYDPVHEWLA